MQARPERKKEEQSHWPKRITICELINVFYTENDHKTAI
jgi:hypothetical protein